MLRVQAVVSGVRKAAMFGVLLAMLVGTRGAAAADTWTKPTAGELSMTALPGYPGAPAVILFKEEVTKDDLHVMQHYERIKVLTEKGKKYANVELRFASYRNDYYDEGGDDKNITDVQGRTIHPDGTIIPFAGKPYKKTIAKSQNASYQAQVFTLPDVEVGSIIEYRYATRIADHVFEAPEWFIQSELYAKSMHFAWYPTTHQLESESGTISTIAWFPILPKGAAVKKQELPNGSRTFEVSLTDVPPETVEDFMPPTSSFTYRVLFYYTPYSSRAEYWQVNGKRWAKTMDGFASPDKLSAITQTVTEGATTQDAKLRKIYAAVMALENTDFTRNRSAAENKAQGMAKTGNAADVYKHGRGSGTQLAEVFVGMARAAGMKAYFMMIPDRAYRLFTADLLSMNQFDNVIAIVVVDGKEQFFDPGQRYVPYGQLAWQDTLSEGLREKEGGVDFDVAPAAPYTATKTLRVADLAVDDHGEVTGELKLTFSGATAVKWRQRALEGDDDSLKRELRTTVEEMIPRTLEVKVKSVDALTDYDQPLIAKFDIHGTMGEGTGKRLILPADLFLSGETNSFPHEKRDIPVYFHYTQTVLDAVRIKFPTNLAIEAAPTEVKIPFEKVGHYSFGSESDAHSITVRRTYLFNGTVVPPDMYGKLRSFYSAFEAKDKESVVLKATATASAAQGGH